MDLPVLPPVKPMLAKPVAAIPPGQLYEPKWDGFRSIVFVDGDEIVLGSRNEKPLTRYFPELVAQFASQLAGVRCVLDGEIIVPGADRERLEFELLQQRIHPAESRIRMLAEQWPAEYVAFDLLALGDEDLTMRPLIERRTRLEELFAGREHPIDRERGLQPPLHLTPLTDDPAVAAQWFADWEGAGLDGIIAKSGDLAYLPDKRVMSKIKHARTADCVVAGYRPHKNDAEAIGSLLLGIYDADGHLASVGVIGAFPMARRKELYAELQPLVTDLKDHPWSWAAEMATQEGARSPRKSEMSRWNNGKDLSFIGLRPELVVEVKYDYLEGNRFRHTAQFSRWRPDRDPASCTFEQLEGVAAYDLKRILPAETDATPAGQSGTQSFPSGTPGD